MADSTPATELQRMLRRDSPGRNDTTNDMPSSAASKVASDVLSDVGLLVSIPKTVQAGVALPIVVELGCYGLDRRDLRAIATLLSYTGEGKLDGNTVETGQRVSPIKMKFCFTLTITNPGTYCVRIRLEETLFGSSYGQIDSEDITVTKVQNSRLRDSNATLDDGLASDVEETTETNRMVNIVNDSNLQPVSTPDETAEKEGLSPPPPRKEPRSMTQIPSAIYSRQSLDILQRLWGARLCAGMKDEAVQGAFKKVHGQMPPKHHELLCRVAWLFQANKMKILSPPWEAFYKFAFGQGSEIEKGCVFGQLTENWNSISNGRRTKEKITTDWQYMFFATGEFLKERLREIGYRLCICGDSQPHSAPQKFLSDSEENRVEERIKQAVFACTALIVFDSRIKDGETSQHTCKDSHKAVRKAIRGFEDAKGLSNEIQDDLRNINAYLNSCGVSSLDLEASKISD
ncbi:hypothetical protein VE01_09458 [Pseudogymnoascus verrucosus]|uniref:Uncharacterized protein n=1 Tax=Pseudogymnoascus verrucosus TaxID=342668 RepID=A0A1B8G9L2_9PEZI|nr:uncharacterized protein VE01_09458 [Pseudogymnoascus verrucosus]OBT92515.1 hypothetical protein VE01_09458 [Pseudogymnoascus verrucosus]